MALNNFCKSESKDKATSERHNKEHSEKSRLVFYRRKQFRKFI